MYSFINLSLFLFYYHFDSFLFANSYEESSTQNPAFNILNLFYTIVNLLKFWFTNSILIKKKKNITNAGYNLNHYLHYLLEVHISTKIEIIN